MLHSVRLSAVLLIISVLVACGGSSNSCDGTSPPREFSVTDYSARSVSYSEPVNDYTQGTGVPIDDETPVHWQHFGIELKTEVLLYQVNARPLSFSLFANARACSPLPPQPSQRITRLSVVSDFAYSDDYAAGAELIGIARLHGAYPVGGPQPLSDYGNNGSPAWGQVGFYFVEPPQYSPQRFVVTIELDDGNVFILETGEVYLSGLADE